MNFLMKSHNFMIIFYT